MAKSKWDEDNPTNLLKRIKVLETRQRELEYLLAVIIDTNRLKIDIPLPSKTVIITTLPVGKVRRVIL